MIDNLPALQLKLRRTAGTNPEIVQMHAGGSALHFLRRQRQTTRGASRDALAVSTSCRCVILRLRGKGDVPWCGRTYRGQITGRPSEFAAYRKKRENCEWSDVHKSVIESVNLELCDKRTITQALLQCPVSVR